ncbi:MAG: hypothetical protein CVT81_00105 [Alphaproteobacteria bacterium HGW-Alphaproteobacteria-3]|jgi:hypothetical protein|nr:MAG: hypothetical protein CVT81_00105 [Alphaproteobacteria bacterium HGW-Alphaproteobacteria-3]
MDTRAYWRDVGHTSSEFVEESSCSASLIFLFLPMAYRKDACSGFGKGQIGSAWLAARMVRTIASSFVCRRTLRQI